MRALILLVLGFVVGLLTAVAFLAVDTTFDGDEDGAERPGNVQLSLDEDALETLIRDELNPLLSAALSIDVKVRDGGLLEVEVGAGSSGVGIEGSLLLDPEVEDGRLAVKVVEASLGEVVAPDRVAELVEAQLQKRLEALAGGIEYRVTAIRTAERRLILEIEL